jgi:hypothetical protein
MRKRAALGVALGFAFALAPSRALADRIVAVEVVASSTAKGKHDKFAAWRAVDGSTGTAWCEGKDDEGLDETIKLTLSEPIALKQLQLYVGLNGSAKEWKENNRPSKLFAQTAPKVGDPMVPLAKAAPMVSQYDTLVKLDLPKPRTLQVIELGLAGVTRGDKAKNNQTCIADISMLADGGEVVTFVYGLPADAMAQLAPAINMLRTAVADCDEAKLGFLVKYPLAQRVAAEEDSHTVKFKNAKALVKACKKNEFPRIPVEADQPGITPNGFGGVNLETGGTEIIHMQMQWMKGTWVLSGLETY